MNGKEVGAKVAKKAKKEENVSQVRLDGSSNFLFLGGEGRATQMRRQKKPSKIPHLLLCYRQVAGVSRTGSARVGWVSWHSLFLFLYQGIAAVFKVSLAKRIINGTSD